MSGACHAINNFFEVFRGLHQRVLASAQFIACVYTVCVTCVCTYVSGCMNSSETSLCRVWSLGASTKPRSCFAKCRLVLMLLDGDLSLGSRPLETSSKCSFYSYPSHHNFLRLIELLTLHRSCKYQKGVKESPVELVSNRLTLLHHTSRISLWTCHRAIQISGQQWELEIMKQIGTR